MSIKISEDYFLVTYPGMPEYKIQTLILDTNCVGSIYKWATASKAVPTPKIFPVLELLRSGKNVEVTYGAMESSWGFDVDTHVTRSNFDRAKLSTFRHYVVAIDTIIKAPEKDFRSWMESPEQKSIPFLPLHSTRLKDFTRDEGKFRDLLQATVQEWVLCLLLLKYLKPLWDSDNFDELFQGFESWVGEAIGIGVGMNSMVTHMAIHGFFGGEIHESFFVKGNNQRQSGKIFKRDNTFKRDKWDERGLAKVARNLALDAVYFRQRNMFQSGMIQHPLESKLVTFPRENTAIVTADRAMNAINCLIQGVVPVKGNLDTINFAHPEGSMITTLKKEEEIKHVLRNPVRDSRILPTSEELLFTAFDLMEELKGV